MLSAAVNWPDAARSNRCMNEEGKKFTLFFRNHYVSSVAPSEILKDGENKTKIRLVLRENRALERGN